MKRCVDKMSIFKELYQYRELLKTNVKKEIRGKYKGSWLGVLWTFLNPLLQLLVYSFVFPYILRVNVEHYTIFMMVALVPWTFFTTAVQNGTASIINEAGIVKKVYFPIYGWDGGETSLPIILVCIKLFINGAFIVEILQKKS